MAVTIRAVSWQLQDERQTFDSCFNRDFS